MANYTKRDERRRAAREQAEQSRPLPTRTPRTPMATGQRMNYWQAVEVIGEAYAAAAWAHFDADQEEEMLVAGDKRHRTLTYAGQTLALSAR